MASVDMQKMTYAEMRGKKVHFDDQMRETHEHSNKDIKREKTKDNCWIGCKNFEDACNKVQSRTAEVDLLHPPKKIRKDRVTVVALDIKCPQKIADYGKEDEYFSKVYDTLVDMYGKENVHGIAIHKDEVHAYTDYTGGIPEERISLIHGHGWISPYAKWTEKGIEREGINGKHFLKKSTYTELNKAIDTMCRNAGLAPMQAEEVKQWKQHNKELDSYIFYTLYDYFVYKERERYLKAVNLYYKNNPQL